MNNIFMIFNIIAIFNMVAINNIFMIFNIIAIIGLIITIVVLKINLDAAKNKANDESKKANDEEEKTLHEPQFSPQIELDCLARLDKLNKEYSALEVKMDNLQGEYDKKRAELDADYTSRCAELESRHQSQLICYNDLVDQCTQLYSSKDTCTIELNELHEINAELVNANDALKTSNAQLQNTHRAALKASEGDLANRLIIYFDLSATEKHLRELLMELRTSYPELTLDMAGIEWRKIWLPKVQAAAGRYELNGKCGIYHLFEIDNPNIGYVGQAVNIKERWYQHIKKMIGVDGKGNERLYNTGLTPDQFGWEVLEDGVEKKFLDEKERYWIEFFGCKEYGLNKK